MDSVGHFKETQNHSIQIDSPLIIIIATMIIQINELLVSIDVIERKVIDDERHDHNWW
jgi:hypothetical protein